MCGIALLGNKLTPLRLRCTPFVLASGVLYKLRVEKVLPGANGGRDL